MYHYFHDRDHLLREAATWAGCPPDTAPARIFKRKLGRRINDDPQRARGRLLNVAVQLLAQKGAIAFSATEAANVADVSRDFVYKHFRDRGHLLREAKARTSEQLFESSTSGVLPNVTLGAIASIMSNPRAYGLKDLHEISIDIDVEKTLILRLQRRADAREGNAAAVGPPSPFVGRVNCIKQDHGQDFGADRRSLRERAAKQ